MTGPDVLLVEDNEDDIDVTLLALRRAGRMNVAVVRDGVEAIDRLLGPGGGPLPRVVFLDLKMPRLDGIEVLKRLRADERTRSLPVVVLTSSTEPRDLSAAYLAGANSYVRKSIDPDEFDAVAEQLGRYWLSLNQVVAR
jgi:two-component system response regulator